MTLSLHPMQTLFLKISLVALLLLSTNNVSAQTSSNQLIVYKDFYFLNSSTLFNYEDYEPSFLNNYGYGLAYQHSVDDRKYRQYELKLAGANSSENNMEIDRLELQVNYRRGKYWRKTISEKIRPRHGFTGRLYYVEEDVASLDSSRFPEENEAYGIGIDYFVGLDFRLSSKMSILVDASLIALDFGADYRTTRNPTLTPRQQEQGGFDFDLNFQRVLKVGVGIKL